MAADIISFPRPAARPVCTALAPRVPRYFAIGQTVRIRSTGEIGPIVSITDGARGPVYHVRTRAAVHGCYTNDIVAAGPSGPSAA